MNDTAEIICPYCEQPNEIFIDYSNGSQQTYVEDCQVCCRPWEVRVDLTGESPMVQVQQTDE